MTPEQARAAIQDPQTEFVIGRRVMASLAMNARIRREWAAGVFAAAREALILEAERIEADLEEYKRLHPEIAAKVARELEVRAEMDAQIQRHHASKASQEETP